VAAERAVMFCSVCDLSPKALFVLPQTDHLLGFIQRFVGARLLTVVTHTTAAVCITCVLLAITCHSFLVASCMFLLDVLSYGAAVGLRSAFIYCHCCSGKGFAAYSCRLENAFYDIVQNYYATEARRIKAHAELLTKSMHQVSFLLALHHSRNLLSFKLSI